MPRDLAPEEVDAFGEWIDSIDELAERFLGHTTQDLYIEVDFEAYEVGVTPEEYFVSCVVPQLADEHGHCYIESMVGNQGTWGAHRPSDHMYES